MLLGVDTGGTFTDFVLLSAEGLRLHKRLSTPDAPERAVLEGIAEMGLAEAARSGRLRVVHGSTVATNAALEHRGVRTVYITNRGFADTLSIGRQTRRELYQLQPLPELPPVPPELCLETGGRLGARGEVVEDLGDDDLQQLRRRVEALAPEAVAINLLFSFLDDRFERAIEATMPPGLFVVRSSAVLPEYREYERGIATWLSAWLGPLVHDYLQRLQQSLAPAPLSVMQSSGGTIEAAQASRRAATLLLSGPAGGLAAALHLGREIGCERLLTFDMGGTSTDVALLDGEIGLSSEGRIRDWPVPVPMVDLHTIGAGGGSIAFVDAGGLLQVGPRSAGADPGPACYGRGGESATVTDANLLLGRLRPGTLLGGNVPLDETAARDALVRLAQPLGMSAEDAALGVLTLANEHMTRALRVISVQRGHDPAEFRLCCFGGAGGLHLCALAEALQMRRALIPAMAGVLSAYGMLVAPRQRQLSRTYNVLLESVPLSAVREVFRELEAEGRAQLRAEGVADDEILAGSSADLRYRGQSSALNLPWDDDAGRLCEAFHRAHEQRYGHRLERPVELVNLRMAVSAPVSVPPLPELPERPDARPIECVELTGFRQPVAVFEREHIAPGQCIEGPALIVERIATSLVAEGWLARCDSRGHLLLERTAPA